MSGKTRDLKVDLSGAVRERLAQEAHDRRTSINNVAVGILAKHFNVPFEGSGRRGPGPKTVEPGQVLLPVPVALWKKVHMAAIDRTKREIVESIFREHYKLDAVAA